MVAQTREFLRSRPERAGAPAPEALACCIDRLAACAQACTACAGACLAEGGADRAGCIRSCLDCAAVCTAAEAVLTRGAEPGSVHVRALLAAAADFCRACARECGRPAEPSGPCMLCRDMCLLCEDACQMVAAGAGEPAGQGG